MVSDLGTWFRVWLCGFGFGCVVSGLGIVFQFILSLGVVVGVMVGLVSTSGEVVGRVSVGEW